MTQLTEDADVEFNTSAAVTGALNEANIIIGGLKKETMFFLATSATPWLKNWVQARIVLEAGYYNRHARIFDGVAMDAVMDMETADGKVTIKAMSMFEEQTETKSYTFEGEVSVNQIASNFASDLGLPLVSEISDDFKVSNYALRNESTIQNLRSLADQTGLEIYMHNGRVYIKEPGGPLENIPALTFGSKDIVGVPQPTPLGADVNVRMTTEPVTGQQIIVDSLKFPQIKQAKLQLQNLRHIGKTRGTQWYTQLVLRGKDFGWYK